MIKPLKTHIRLPAAAALCLLLLGCTNEKLILIRPTVVTRTVSIDTDRRMPEEWALKYAIKILNETQYGVLLTEESLGEKQVFPYNKLFVTLEEKTTHGLIGKTTVCVLEIKNCCGSPEGSSGPRRVYTRSFSTSMAEAGELVAALISLGATPCCYGEVCE